MAIEDEAGVGQSSGDQSLPSCPVGPKTARAISRYLCPRARHEGAELRISLHSLNFGVDFNPAANRLRVISDIGQNCATTRQTALPLRTPVPATAFATLTPVNGSATLYRVYLHSGAATGVEQFPLPITDIAVALDND